MKFKQRMKEKFKTAEIRLALEEVAHLERFVKLLLAVLLRSSPPVHYLHEFFQLDGAVA